jgi:hypothetical protein
MTDGENKVIRLVEEKLEALRRKDRAQWTRNRAGQVIQKERPLRTLVARRGECRKLACKIVRARREARRPET